MRRTWNVPKIGQQLGTRTVLAEAQPFAGGKRAWRVVCCKCQVEARVRQEHLMRGLANCRCQQKRPERVTKPKPKKERTIIMPRWTEERIEFLTDRWAEGASATVVAAELGVGFTRNAVIGKVGRLGLPARKSKERSPRGSGQFPTVQSAKRQKAPKPPKEQIKPTRAHVILRPKATELSKHDLRRMLSEAVRNTAAMECA